MCKEAAVSITKFLQKKVAASPFHLEKALKGVGEGIWVLELET